MSTIDNNVRNQSSPRASKILCYTLGSILTVGSLVSGGVSSWDYINEQESKRKRPTRASVEEEFRRRAEANVIFNTAAFYLMKPGRWITYKAKNIE